MKEVTIVASIVNDEIDALLYEISSKSIPKEFAKRYYKQVEYPFVPDSEELQQAIDILKNCKIEYRLFREVYYSKRELEQIPYFYVVDEYPLEVEGTMLSDYGTKYLDGKLVSDVLVDRKFMKKTKWGYLDPKRVVSQQVKDIIEANELTGITFSDVAVRDYKGRDMQPFYVVQIQNILPPLSDQTWLSQKWDMLYKESDLRYEREKLQEALDFNLTCEKLNNFHQQYVIVSARVRKVFKENGIRLRFEPVLLLD